MHSSCQIIRFASATAGLNLADPQLRVDLGAEGNTEPKWQLVFPQGIERHRSDFPGGKLVFDRAALAAMQANYAAEGKPRRAVNYFHRGASDAPGTIDDKIAAGWIADVALDKGATPGLYAQIEWTDRAKKYIGARELQFISPEFHPAATSKRTGEPIGMQLLGAALLNDPYLTELPAVAASANPPVTGAPRMELAELIKLLKLKADATEADVRKALAERDAVALSEKTAALQLADAQASVTKLSEQLATATKELAETKAEKTKAEVSAFLDARVRAGQVTPATRPDYEKLALAHGLASIAFLEKAPAVVPVAEKGITGGESDQAKRDSANTQYWAKHAELVKSGLEFSAASRATAKALPEAHKILFG